MIEQPDIKLSKNIYNKFFQGMKNKFFVECGANTGYHRSICYWFEKEHGWRGVNVECNPHCFKQLKINRPHCVNVNYALAEKDTTAILHYPIDAPRKQLTGGGSIIYDEAHWKDRPVEKCNVKTVTYSHFIEDCNIKSIDLFVLDVEGNELNVLISLTKSSVLPKVFCVETNKVSKKQIKDILFPLGYYVDGGDSSNTYFVR